MRCLLKPTKCPMSVYCEIGHVVKEIQMFHSRNKFIAVDIFS